jgi:hypothetical protein
VPSAVIEMPRGLIRPVATVVHAAGSPEALALGLSDVDGTADGLETALLGVALEAGRLVVGLAVGPAQAASAIAIDAIPARAGRAAIAACCDRVNLNSLYRCADVY